MKIGISPNMDGDHARQQIGMIEESLKSFIAECNSPIDNTKSREILVRRYNEVSSRFDDIYRLLEEIPNAVIACKLQLSMEILLDEAKRVFEVAVERNAESAREVRKPNVPAPFVPSQQCSDNAKSHVETGNSDNSYKNLILDVPVFCGNISEFPAFKEAFDRTFHNTDLPTSFKFAALKSRVDGPLLDAVLRSGDDYNRAYRSLVWQFSEARSKLDDFLLIPGFKNISSKEIEEYRASITEARRGVVELNLPDLGDYILFISAYNRLPDALREEFVETFEPANVPTFQQLLNFLSERINLLKYSERDKQLSSPGDGQRSGGCSVPRTYHDGTIPSDSVTSGTAKGNLSSLSQKPVYCYTESHSFGDSRTFPAIDNEGAAYGDTQQNRTPSRPNAVLNESHTLDAMSLSSFSDSDGPECSDSKPRKSNCGDNEYTRRSSSSNPTRQTCHVCNQRHSIRNCAIFRDFSVAKRRSYMEEFDHICRNCLAQWHKTSDCNSLQNCKICSKRHHILLHPATGTQQSPRRKVDDNIVDWEIKLSDLKKEIRMFRSTKSSPPLSSCDEFLLSSPASD